MTFIELILMNAVKPEGIFSAKYFSRRVFLNCSLASSETMVFFDTVTPSSGSMRVPKSGTEDMSCLVTLRMKWLSRIFAMSAAMAVFVLPFSLCKM